MLKTKVPVGCKEFVQSHLLLADEVLCAGLTEGEEFIELMRKAREELHYSNFYSNEMIRHDLAVEYRILTGIKV